MKTYKATIIEDIISGTLIKTKTFKAKDEEDAQKFIEEEGDIGWEEVEENKTNDEGVCKNCDQLTPRSDLREYRRDIYFCSRCLEDYTLESQEGGA